MNDYTTNKSISVIFFHFKSGFYMILMIVISLFFLKQDKCFWFGSSNNICNVLGSDRKPNFYYLVMKQEEKKVEEEEERMLLCSIA